MVFKDDFTHELSSHWYRCTEGNAGIEVAGGSLRLVNNDKTSRQYTNAQIDDYHGLPRRQFLWSPPLRLVVRARFSHPGPRLRDDGDCDFVYHPDAGGGPILSGTAGFGFWNDPFAPPGAARRGLPAAPRAIWFFYASPPSNMKLERRTPGCGWKAATIDASRPPFWLLAPTTPVAVPLMRLPAAYRRLWPIGQAALRVSEAPVPATMTDWHRYVVEWGHHRARFLVDGALVLDCQTPPRGPLGLVIWLDNQFMVVTPQGRFSYGLLTQPGTQWLELSSVIVDSGHEVLPAFGRQE